MLHKEMIKLLLIQVFMNYSGSSVLAGLLFICSNEFFVIVVPTSELDISQRYFATCLKSATQIFPNYTILSVYGLNWLCMFK